MRESICSCVLLMLVHALVLAHVSGIARAVSARDHVVVAADVGVVEGLVVSLLLDTLKSELLGEGRDLGMLTELAGLVDQVLVVQSEHVQKIILLFGSLRLQLN